MSRRNPGTSPCSAYPRRRSHPKAWHSVAGGAFLLFVTNLVSIIISAAAVFRVMGFQLIAKIPKESK